MDDLGGLTPAQLAAIQAAVREAVKAERDAALVGAPSVLPRPGAAAAPASLILEKDPSEYETHPMHPHVIKVGTVYVSHRDGELYNDHGQRIGRRVDVYTPGWDRAPGSVKT